MKRKLILYIACSLDGYISEPNDKLDFLSMVEQEGEDYGYVDFVKSVDAVIMGRKTYDIVMAMGIGFPHADKETYIITRTEKPSEGSVNFYTGNLNDLVQQLKSKEGKNIYCDGGAEIVNELLRLQVFDELVVSIIPVLLGSGTKLFQEGIPKKNLKLISSKSFEKGLVQLRYALNT
jgi:dihydrofolate reductase